MRERILLAREMKLCDEYTISTLGVPSRTLWNVPRTPWLRK